MSLYKTPNNYYSSTRHEIHEYIPKNIHRVLEIGCGDANFSKFLSGKEYWGVEPNTNIDQLELPNIFKVIKSNYEDAYVNLPDYYFDLVVVNDVIEHMDDHDHFFESIKKKMITGGYILGSIPNVRHISNLINLLFHKDWHYQSSGILDRTHLRFFTIKSLTRILELHGYKIKFVKPINRQLSKKIGLKNILERILCFFLGRDTEFNQIVFCVYRE